MMRCKLISALRILLILSLLQTICRAIDCYQCNSIVDPDCSTKKVNKKYLQPCPKTHDYCRKSDSIYYFTDSREFITIRECARFRTDGRECYRGKYTRDSYQRVCECKVSGCNRSTNSVTEVPKIAIVFLLVFQFCCT